MQDSSDHDTVIMLITRNVTLYYNELLSTFFAYFRTAFLVKTREFAMQRNKITGRSRKWLVTVDLEHVFRIRFGFFCDPTSRASRQRCDFSAITRMPISIMQLICILPDVINISYIDFSRSIAIRREAIRAYRPKRSLLNFLIKGN